MLYIIKEDYFLADYILDSLNDRDDIVQIRLERTKYRGYKKFQQSVVRYIRSILFNKKGLWNEWFFTHDFLRQLKRIGPNDKVLFFSCQNLKELMVLDREVACLSKHVFLWNPLSTVNHNLYSNWEYVHHVRKMQMTVCTFDEGDAGAYDIKLVNQVYRRPGEELQVESSNINNDVFFIGKDKRRSKSISDILDEFDRQSITHDFYILRDKHTKALPKLLPYYTDASISYDDYCKRAMRSKCLLEILQDGQTGMTVRTLEALFFNKKLITTNSCIRHQCIYHPNNIYVLDRDEKRTIREFLDCEYHTFPQSVIEQFDIKHWIKQFE